MAVKALVSEQRIISRYERQREVDRGGRFATRDRHDAAYEGLRGSIERVEVTRCVDAVTLYDASHLPIYRNRLANDRWQDAPSAAQALSTERERPFTDPEREGYAAALARIDEMLKAPDRRATAEDFARVQDLRERSSPRQADRPEYKLSEAENQRIFEQDVIPYLLATAYGKVETRAEPVMVMVGGQPGAGKSRSMDSVKDDLEHDGGVVEISVDDLRKFHPLNDALMRRDNRSAANFTHADARLWAEKAERFARERRFNLVLEGTMKTPEHTASRLSDYRRDGYFVEVRLIATPERSSWQGVLERYEKQRADNGAGRMTPKDIHDAAIAGVLGTVERIERDGLANRVWVDRRGAEQLYCATLDEDGTWKHAQVETSARRAIEQERAAPWSVRQWDAHIAGYDRIEALLHRHGRDATAQEFRQIADLRASALAAGAPIRSACRARADLNRQIRSPA
jgi:hypothetical protein